MIVTDDGVELHLAEDGDPAAPPLLLLHGITASGRTWDWFVPDLAERFRVLRLDFRGHGRSGRAPGRYAPADYAGDAIAALEQGAGAPALVIGHSLGGATATALTQRRPDLLVAAVMEDPPLVTPGATRAEALEGNSLIEGFRVMRQSVPDLQAMGLSAADLVGLIGGLPDPTGESTFAEALHPDALDAMADALLRLDATVLDALLDGTVPHFIDPDVPFGVPSLVLAADPAKPDAVANVEVAERFAARSDDVEVRVVEGAGHLIHEGVTSRAVFRDAVLAFLDRVAPA